MKQVKDVLPIGAGDEGDCLSEKLANYLATNGVADASALPIALRIIIGLANYEKTGSVEAAAEHWE